MDASIRSRSLILSVLIHTALFLLLLFVVMNTTIPPFPESGGGGGVLVNIGYIDAATGAIQPLSQNVAEHPEVVKTQPSPKSEEKVATQENEESVAMNDTKKNIKKHDSKVKVPPVREEKKVVEKPRQPEAGGQYNPKPNNSKSQGTSASGGGDQGARNGVPNGGYQGKNGTGGGPGSGTGTGGGDGDGKGPGKGSGFEFSLVGRQLLKKPTIDDRSQETGRVVVAITVNKDGAVTDARPGARGTTTTSSYLFGKAKDAAMKAKFSPDPNGNDIQKGTITFVFLVQ